MQILSMIFYAAITLGVLVFVHEFGHFIAAKLTGTRVDRFSIGFPPRAFGKKIGETDYCVSWIPIGGFVKIAGMVDESMDTDFLDKPREPWEFRSKPMWARVAMISAGVFMNVLLAVLIFWAIHYLRGTYVAETTRVGDVGSGSAFEQAGLQSGDSIVSVNGKLVTQWDELQNLIYLENLGNDLSIVADRRGKQVSIFIPARHVQQPSDTMPGLQVAYTVASIDAVELNMPAERLGLKPGDIILTINGAYVDQQRLVSTVKKNAGQTIKLVWKRGNDTLSGTTSVTSEGRIGIRIGSRYIGPSKHITYSLLGALPEGIKDVGQSIHLFYLTFSKIFAGKASVKESLGGPIAIAQLATQSAESGLLVFLWFMAQLSMSLAILNILPFPALDGGHLMMIIYEKVFGREIPSKVKIAIQQAGFILLLAFMAFVIYNDITRF